MVQRQLVFQPPAVLLLSIVAVTETSGTIGIMFAAPITINRLCHGQEAYIRDSLAQPTELARESADAKGT